MESKIKAGSLVKANCDLSSQLRATLKMSWLALGASHPELFGC